MSTYSETGMGNTYLISRASSYAAECVLDGTSNRVDGGLESGSVIVRHLGKFDNVG